MPETEPVAAAGMDIEAMADQIGAEMFPAEETPEPMETLDDAPADVPAASLPAEAAAPSPVPTPEPVAKAAPKSWPKEMHDHWGKTPKEVQDYWETREKQMLDGLDQYKAEAQFGKTLREVLTPFQAILQQQGIEAPRAIHALMTAHQRLTTGTMEQRKAAYDALGRDIGLTATTGTEATPQQMDPAVQRLQTELEQIKSSLTAQQQTALDAARAKAEQEVSAFASDPTHAYFEEVHEDIVKFLKSGDSLQDAYDKAVWANPVTRQKELARVQTETEAKFRENARLEALPKKRAVAANVRSRETQRTPTEPLGSMEDTMKSALADIRSRSSH